MEDSTAGLIRKLGIKPHVRLFTLHAPDNYLKEITELTNCNDFGEIMEGAMWVQAFYKDKQSLENEIAKLKDTVDKTGQLWISWPKKSSGIRSDLSDNEVRRIGLDSGLVDIKVAAIDDTW